MFLDPPHCLHHAMARGERREDTVHDDADCETLAESSPFEGK
jgi:hypothetical protein